MVDSVPDSYRVTAEELRQFVERFERLEIEKKDIADQQKKCWLRQNHVDMILGFCGKLYR